MLFVSCTGITLPGAMRGVPLCWPWAAGCDCVFCGTPPRFPRDAVSCAHTGAHRQRAIKTLKLEFLSTVDLPSVQIHDAVLCNVVKGRVVRCDSRMVGFAQN